MKEPPRVFSSGSSGPRCGLQSTSSGRSGGGYPLVEVTWVDSTGTPGWQREIQVKPLVCHTAGYLMRSSRNSVVVALSVSEERSANTCADTMTIPRGSVKRIRRLK